MEYIGYTDVYTHTNIGITDWNENEVPPFAKIFVTKDNNGEPVSYALGINVWGLLLMASMGATTLHPNVVCDISRTIIKDILDKAPTAATPGNICLVRSFHILTTSTQRIILNPKNRPKHFPRPLGDLSFATTGVFTYAKNVDKYMPEDVMHCGFLFSLAKMFSCTIYEIPGRVVYSDYDIIAGVLYPIWNPEAIVCGCLEVTANDVVMKVHDEDESSTSETHWSFSEWTEHFQQSDFVMIPLITRTGACVLHLGRLGLLVPLEGQHNNYSYDDRYGGSYQYIHDAGKIPVNITVMEAMDKLVSVGSIMYVNLNTDALQHLKEKVPRLQRNLEWLEVRLNTPNVACPECDKVYITYMVRPTKANMDVCALSSVTIAVDVWDISPTVDEDVELITALML